MSSKTRLLCQKNLKNNMSIHSTTPTLGLNPLFTLYKSFICLYLCLFPRELDNRPECCYYWKPWMWLKQVLKSNNKNILCFYLQLKDLYFRKIFPVGDDGGGAKHLTSLKHHDDAQWIFQYIRYWFCYCSKVTPTSMLVYTHDSKKNLKTLNGLPVTLKRQLTLMG